MKKLILLAFLCSFSLFAESAMCVVNMEKLFADYYKTKLAETQFKKKTDAFKQYAQNAISQHKSLKKELEELKVASQSIALSPETRKIKIGEMNIKEQELAKKEQEIVAFNRDKKKELMDEFMQVRKKLIDEIKNLVTAYCKDKKYTIVIDSSGKTANGLSSVVYFDQSLDITATLLSSLNKK